MEGEVKKENAEKEGKSKVEILHEQNAKIAAIEAELDSEASKEQIKEDKLIEEAKEKIRKE